ncbi:MAG TPA: hypothetical protein VHQ03_08010 [Candidatus Dormibacteraeota bacterium]|nr:hypothetical protein [Candidatus Dormibacteraeota bacterium]
MATTSPTPSPPATATPAETICKLPVSIADSAGHLEGAFMGYPGGKVTIDPAGDGGAYYDRANKRWLPVPVSAISPDRTRYAYLERKIPGTTGRARLHLVDVATGGDSAYEIGPPGDTSAYLIVDYGAEGIWLTYAGYEAPIQGLLLLADPTTGVLTDKSGGKQLDVPLYGGPGVFWYTDPGSNPQVSAIGFPTPSRVQRLTVADGTSEAWFERPGSYVQMFGTDLAGHPIFGTTSTGNDYDMWIASSPGQVRAIGVAKGGYVVMADERGVWMGGTTGVYLYTTSGDVVTLSTQAALPAGTCA